jgi:hypothetical protein
MTRWQEGHFGATEPERAAPKAWPRPSPARRKGRAAVEHHTADNTNLTRPGVVEPRGVVTIYRSRPRRTRESVRPIR